MFQHQTDADFLQEIRATIKSALSDMVLGVIAHKDMMLFLFRKNRTAVIWRTKTKECNLVLVQDDEEVGKRVVAEWSDAETELTVQFLKQDD